MQVPRRWSWSDGATAFDCCRKIFVMGTMFVLLPAAFLHFRGLDFEPTVSLMHIISSIHYHYVQDMDNPRAVTRRHETLMVLDYFWAHLDVCSCFVYLSGIQSRYLRAMAYMSFVYGLIALLTSKDRKRRQQHLAALVLGGGCSLLVGRYLLTGEAPRIKWSGLPIPFLLFGYAAYNFFILQEKHPNMYWLHHGLWHITGNATLLALIHLKYVNE
ncbi:hypothetical protein CBR_g46845 [Chara braunii]|uniref:Uncharacterized protein n=1 Tax=Chara braunii TaxID=69332 RepID=A0A388M1C6_CHABU|nr:hypothetical protein CBR_g46845 [Chara braunii]|eukprot:GBG88279.1 hypothetical protein CBR_g46845 [Chara braunii]